MTGLALAGVIGWPISHSFSPHLHAHWLKSLGIPGHYVPLAVSPDRLADCLALLPELGFRGVNVTVPHKEAVIPHLAELTAMAKAVGAVNVIDFSDPAGPIGDNSDVDGFITHLTTSIAPRTLTGKKVRLLGAGGAARAAVAGLIQAGCTPIEISNRNRARAEDLAAQWPGKVQVTDWAQRDRELGKVDILVNTTSLGMTGQPPLHVDLSALPTGAIVYDIVYNPRMTPLLAQAQERGDLTIVPGLGMLIDQARPAFKRFFGLDAPATDQALIDLMTGLMK